MIGFIMPFGKIIDSQPERVLSMAKQGFSKLPATQFIKVDQNIIFFYHFLRFLIIKSKRKNQYRGNHFHQKGKALVLPSERKYWQISLNEQKIKLNL